ncbi:MAG: transcriptional repressor AgaR [bacterium]
MKGTPERRDEIVRLVSEDGRVTVKKLSEMYNVSTVTIRNDLNFLQEKGLLHRAYGGALRWDTVSFDTAIREKEKLNAEEKKKIGKAASKLINDGDSIIIDSGTTTMEIAKNIHGKRDLTVMTNAINIATDLAGISGITLMLTGGTLRETSFSLVGPQAEEILEEFYFDKVFLGVDGFDMEYGLTTPNFLEAQLNRLMVNRSRETIVVMDSSKFARRSLSLIVKPNDVDIVITDSKVTDEYKKRIEDMDIKLIVV